MGHALSEIRELLELVPDGIVMANPSGSIVFANGQAEQLFGYDGGELVGMPIESLLPESLARQHVAHRANYFSQPRTRAMGAGHALRGRRKDGSEFPVEISLSPFRTDEGLFALSAIRDITDRRRIEEALSERNEELRAAAEAKDRFLANMSHELRTPLNAILGFTGTLLMKLPGPLTPDQQKQLTTIKSSARHLLSLINDLLDLAKIESGKVDLVIEPVKMADVLEDVASTLRPLAEAKGLRFDARPPFAAPTVRTDRRAVSQIVINLLNNAIKYTEIGRITVSLIERAEADGARVLFLVSDTGVGIRAADQSRLFQAFTQLDSSTTRRYEGTGLGLHLSHKLAELLGGRITFESEPGVGSTFTLSLPKR